MPFTAQAVDEKNKKIYEKNVNKKILAVRLYFSVIHLRNHSSYSMNHSLTKPDPPIFSFVTVAHDAHNKLSLLLTAVKRDPPGMLFAPKQQTDSKRVEMVE